MAARAQNRLAVYCGEPAGHWPLSPSYQPVTTHLRSAHDALYDVAGLWAADSGGAGYESAVEWYTLQEAAESLKLQELETRVQTLERFAGERTLCVPITSLAPEPYVVKESIPVVVVPDEDEFTASFYDANLHASGDTEQEAYENLKSLMVAIYAKLACLPDSKLGPLPRRQLAVLKSVMAPKE